MERTWKPTTAGILTIIGGIFGIVAGAFATTISALIGTLAEMPGLGAMIGAPLLGIGIVALIGGIYTMKRKAWGFALTGAILALFPIIPLGVLAIIFVSMGKKEFA
jgi:hypothetical protein